MVSIRRKILERGSLIKEQFIRLLQNHEDRISALEKGVDPDGVSIADLTDAEVVEAVITYEDESTATVYFVTQDNSNDTIQQEPEGS